MINYFWIIEDILEKKPETYKIVLRSDVVNVLQMINCYLCKKCKYTVVMKEVNKGDDLETIIDLQLNWP